MQFFYVTLAKVRTVKQVNRNTFDPIIAPIRSGPGGQASNQNKSGMEKIITNPWYVKKCITLLIFIALLVTVALLKRISVTGSDPRSQFSTRLAPEFRH